MELLVLKKSSCKENQTFWMKISIYFSRTLNFLMRPWWIHNLLFWVIQIDWIWNKMLIYLTNEMCLQHRRSVALIILCLQGFILYYNVLFKAWEYKAVHTIDLFHNWNNSHNKKTSHIKLGYTHTIRYVE